VRPGGEGPTKERLSRQGTSYLCTHQKGKKKTTPIGEDDKERNGGVKVLHIVSKTKKKREDNITKRQQGGKDHRTILQGDLTGRFR